MVLLQKLFGTRHVFLKVYIGLWSILFVVAFIPWVRNYWIVPSDRYYYGGDEYAIDLAGNLAIILQGYLGKWKLVFDPAAQVLSNPTLLKVEYIILGHLARIVHADHVLIFSLFRWLLVPIWMTLLYCIIRRTFVRFEQQVFATFCVLFAGSITLQNHDAPFVLRAVIDSLVFHRVTTAMPHYIAGAFVGVFSLFALSRGINKNERWQIWYILSLLSACITSWVYAPTMVAIFSAFPFYAMIRFVDAVKTKNSIVREVILFAGYILIALLPVFYVRYTIATELNELRLTQNMERANPFHVGFSEYLLIVGIPYILSWVAVPRILRRKNTFFLLLISWVVMHPIGEFIFSPKIDLNPIRYFLTPYYIVFPLLAVEGVTTIVERLSKVHRFFNFSAIAGGIGILIVLSSLRTYSIVWDRASPCFCLPLGYDFSYPKKDFMEGMYWFRKNTDPNHRVMADIYAGVLIPAFAGNKIYTSMWFYISGSPDFEEARYWVKSFYAQTLPGDLAHEFIEKYSMKYVLLSDQERQYTPQHGDLTYPFLRPVFRSGGVVIYEVI